MLEIHEATPNEVERFLPLARRCWKKITSLPGDLCSETFVAFWDTVIRNGSGVIFYGEQNGEVRGGIGAIALVDLTGELICREQFWYSETPGLGGDLLDRLEDRCREKGIQRLIMPVPYCQGDREGFFFRRGYQPMERTYSIELGE